MEILLLIPMPKSQTSVEYLFLVIIAFMVSLIFIVVSLNHQKELESRKEYILLRDIALKLQSEILLAANVGDGYSRTFTLPPKLEIFDYSINISNRTFIFVESKNHHVILRIPNVNGTVDKGENLIQKNDGIIKIN